MDLDKVQAWSFWPTSTTLPFRITDVVVDTLRELYLEPRKINISLKSSRPLTYSTHPIPIAMFNDDFGRHRGTYSLTTR